VNIAFIKRGEIMIQIPNKTERLFQMKFVIGSDEQVKEFAFLTKHEIEIPKKVNNEVILKQIELQRNFIGLVLTVKTVSLLIQALNVTVNAC
jgi:CPA2 family monovalent cation:H+ antiporter-2